MRRHPDEQEQAWPVLALSWSLRGQSRDYDRGRLVQALGPRGQQSPSVEGEDGAPVPVVSLPAEDGRRRRPPAGRP